MTAPTPAQRRIEFLPLSKVIASHHEKNPKRHDVDTINASVTRFGFVEPIAIDGRTNKIISGHGRAKTLAAMYERGDAAPEGVECNDDGTWNIPVVVGWSSRSDYEAQAALIAMNRANERGGWDTDGLLDLLDDLETVEDGLAGVGYDPAEVEDLRKHIGHISSIGIDDMSNYDDDGDNFLNELADGFDPETADDRRNLSGKAAAMENNKCTVILTGDMVAKWFIYREEFESDNEAFAALLPVGE